MLTVALLLFGTVLLALAIGERAVRALPITPALVYLVVGAAAGAVLGPLPQRAPPALLDPALLGVATEFAVLVSLFAVGLRLRLMPTLAAWRVALLLAGPGMVVAVVLGAAVAVPLLGLPWGAAITLAAILAPTDPVLASEVQIRGDHDRDAVRLALTAEGGLNDGAALPAVMLGLGLLGLHPLGGADGAPGWWWNDLLWPIAGGALVGAAAGWALGVALRARARRGDPLARDELLYIGGVALAYGLARATATSAFVVAFVFAVTLLLPIRADRLNAGSEAPLAGRLHDFGASVERLVEAGAVLAVGALLPTLAPDAATIAFALVLVFVVRPLSVWAVVRRAHMASGHQRRLVAWFGIRGIGSLFYLAYVIEHGVAGAVAERLVDATLVAIAASVLLHGLSATRVMQAYQRRRAPPR